MSEPNRYARAARLRGVAARPAQPVSDRVMRYALALLVALATLFASFETRAQGGAATVIHVGKARVIDLPAEARDVVVSDPNIVDATLRTARSAVLYGMKVGQANVLFFDAAGRRLRSVEIRVEHDTRSLEDMLAIRFPASQVRVSSLLGEMVLDGSAPSSAEAVAIADVASRFLRAARASRGESASDKLAVVNRIAVTNEEQVHIKVRVAEVSRGVLKELGVDWNAILQSTAVSGTANLTGRGVTDLFRNESALISFGAIFDTFLNALEQHSLVRTLAEPSLTATSGESASFLAGGEFPVPVAADEDTITVEFKKFGVGLDFTPVVLGDGRISMQIATEVSELTDNGAFNIQGLAISGLTVRRANSTLELSSGGTIVMAGLLQQSTRRLSTGLPGLRQLPVLGQLFRSEEYENEETELVILVTPYVVQQGRLDDFRLPTDGYAPASDLDMYLFGRLHAVYGAEGVDPAEAVARGERAAAAAKGAPLGFIME